MPRRQFFLQLRLLQGCSCAYHPERKSRYFVEYIFRFKRYIYFRSERWGVIRSNCTAVVTSTRLNTITSCCCYGARYDYTEMSEACRVHPIIGVHPAQVVAHHAPRDKSVNLVRTWYVRLYVPGRSGEKSTAAVFDVHTLNSSPLLYSNTTLTLTGTYLVVNIIYVSPIVSILEASWWRSIRDRLPPATKFRLARALTLRRPRVIESIVISVDYPLWEEKTTRSTVSSLSSRALLWGCCKPALRFLHPCGRATEHYS